MKILIIKPSSIGDIIQALRVAQSIYDQLPNVEISWVVRDRFAEIVRKCPAVNGQILEFQRTNGMRAGWRLLKALRSRTYDAVFDFQGLLRSGLMTAAARSPLKLGHRRCREGSHLFYHQLVPLPPGGQTAHHVDLMLQFLPAIGLRPELTQPIALQCDPPWHVDSRLRGLRPIVLLPNSREPSREWPYFIDLACQILSSDTSTPVVWDSHIHFSIPDRLKNNRFINLSTKTGLMDMMGLLKTARLVVANDSGGTHVAAALGVPVLGLYGPTSASQTGPFPPNNGTNHVLEAPGGDLSLLSPEEVLKRVLELTSQPDCTGVAA